MPVPLFQYEVFLSHSSEDKAVVRLSNSLSASAGESPLVDSPLATHKHAVVIGR